VWSKKPWGIFYNSLFGVWIKKTGAQSSLVLWRYPGIALFDTWSFGRAILESLGESALYSFNHPRSRGVGYSNDNLGVGKREYHITNQIIGTHARGAGVVSTGGRKGTFMPPPPGLEQGMKGSNFCNIFATIAQERGFWMF